MDNPRDEFWDRIEDVNDGMLNIGSGSFTPMSPQVRDDANDGKIWFITAAGTSFANATQTGPVASNLIVADRSAAIYADIAGTLELSHDREVLDEVWSVMASAWFEEGKQDADVRLLCFTPTQAEVSLVEESSVRLFYEMAKAAITGDKPDAGWQGTITF
ncbi:pyridoxamine 5'-phosphate oxidase family protein [Yoonia maritima]|uniref:pyridoxamine 5'-phosphate oxidase family protein n=1 Tax=Yoonia maritima TaxID=1435347 RepID=UPI000D0F9608|nr:pyridoxamine 5'-phosphate oxidase family protein [Yoonia maritima]